jgi:hypothetical protein
MGLESPSNHMRWLGHVQVLRSSDPQHTQAHRYELGLDTEQPWVATFPAAEGWEVRGARADDLPRNEWHALEPDPYWVMITDDGSMSLAYYPDVPYPGKLKRL